MGSGQDGHRLRTAGTIRAFDVQAESCWRGRDAWNAGIQERHAFHRTKVAPREISALLSVHTLAPGKTQTTGESCESNAVMAIAQIPHQSTQLSSSYNRCGAPGLPGRVAIGRLSIDPRPHRRATLNTRRDRAQLHRRVVQTCLAESDSKSNNGTQDSNLCDFISWFGTRTSMVQIHSPRPMLLGSSKFRPRDP